MQEGPELDRLVDELCEAFNSDPRSAQVDLKAKPFRRHHMDKRFADYLPDILFDHIDEVFLDAESLKN